MVALIVVQQSSKYPRDEYMQARMTQQCHSQGTAIQTDWHAVSQSSAKLYRDLPQDGQMSAKAEEKTVRLKRNQFIQRCSTIDGEDCRGTKKSLGLMCHKMSSQKKTHCDCDAESTLCGVCSDVLSIDKGVGFGRTDITVVIIPICSSSSIQNGASRSCKTY